MRANKGVRGAEQASARLRADQLLRPIAEQRAALSILVRRMDRAVRATLMTDLSARVRSDSRFAPVLGKLVKMALNS